MGRILFGPLRTSVALTSAIFCGTLLALAHSAAATTIGTGYDLIATNGGSITISPTNPIPAGFFGPGSQPFDGVILLGGDPNGPGNTDTIVQRLGGLGPVPPFTFPAGAGAVPIEIVALNLVSVQPITVNYGGPTQQWNIDISLPVAPPQPIGSMNIQHSHANGGTFSATLPVQPVILFTPIGPGTPNTLQPLGNLSYGSLWSHTPGPNDAHNFAYPDGDLSTGVDPADDNLVVWGAVGNLVDNGHGPPIPLLLNLNQQAAELVPEPDTFVLAALSFIGLGLFAWRCRRR